jgi:hypothetical protein
MEEMEMDEAVELEIERVDDPRDEVPLPAGWEAGDMEFAGGFYEVSAGSRVSTPYGHYLVLGLPVLQPVLRPVQRLREQSLHDCRSVPQIVDGFEARAFRWLGKGLMSGFLRVAHDAMLGGDRQYRVGQCHHHPHRGPLGGGGDRNRARNPHGLGDAG